MVKEKFVLTKPEEIQNVREWVKAGRGLYRWTNKEIGNNRPDVLIPGDHDKAPHWAYVGQPESVELDEIEIHVITPVLQPREWGVECERCKGTGKRSVAELAEIRKQTVAEVLAIVMRGDIHWKLIDEDHFECNFCSGRGYNEKPLTFRMKREWWGGWKASDTAILKMNKLKEKLSKYYEKDVQVDSERHSEGNIFKAVFFTREVKPFTLE